MASIKRRDFLKSTALAVTGMLLYPISAHADGGFRFLSEESRGCLIALCEQIIPRDNDPGATDAGVIHYIEKQVSTIFESDTTKYLHGLKSLQALSKREMGQSFETLESQAQISIMEKMERGQLPDEDWPKISASAFFNLVLKHTMQAFYGSPIHGGNKDYASFRMLGLGFPMINE